MIHVFKAICWHKCGAKREIIPLDEYIENKSKIDEFKTQLKKRTGFNEIDIYYSEKLN